MKSPRAFIMILVALGFHIAGAQDTRLPAKDVAILADVSRSVAGDWKMHEEAREMIAQLLTGNPIAWENSAWEVQATSDADMLSLFGKALGRPDGTHAVQPLTAPGRNLMVLRVGKLSTVNGSATTRQVNQMAHLKELVDTEYPKLSDIKDNSTCFWYAMARAASLLRESSPDGYYLFVVSDEDDDPDYLEHGGPKHSLNDYREYQKKLAGQFPPNWILGQIDRHFQKNTAFTNQPGQKAYLPRGDFPMTLIATIRQRGVAMNDDRKVRLSWYAMGVRPEPVVQPAAPAPAAALEPPLFRRRIQLLGGLEAFGTKTFRYRNPLLVWQIPNGEIDGLNSARFQVRTADNKLVPSVPVNDPDARVSPRLAGPKTAQLKLNSGKYTLQVVEAGQDGASALKSKPVSIEIIPRNDWMLATAAIVAGLLAVSIFIYTWRSLGSPAPAPARGK